MAELTAACCASACRAAAEDDSATAFSAWLCLTLQASCTPQDPSRPPERRHTRPPNNSSKGSRTTAGARPNAAPTTARVRASSRAAPAAACRSPSAAPRHPAGSARTRPIVSADTPPRFIRRQQRRTRNTPTHARVEKERGGGRGRKGKREREREREREQTTQWVGLGLIPDSDLTRRPGINQISGWRQACA
jgi:hypothetical protein